MDKCLQFGYATNVKMSANSGYHSAKYLTEIDTLVPIGASLRMSILYFIYLRIVEKSPTEELNPLPISHTANVIS
jgi:hypothetical protein